MSDLALPEKPRRRSPAKLPPSLDPLALIPSEEVRRLMGGWTASTLSNKCRRGEFPRPNVKTGSSCYWRRQVVLNVIDELEAATRAAPVTVTDRRAEAGRKGGLAKAANAAASKSTLETAGADSAETGPSPRSSAGGGAAGATPATVRG